jgi:hypothetical protein
VSVSVRPGGVADAADRVAQPHDLLEAPRHADEQLVPSLVTQAVVHHLEAVEIDAQHGVREVGPPARELDAPNEAVHEEHPVRQRRQAIGHLALGDVGERPGQTNGRPSSVPHGEAASQHPPVSSRGVAYPVFDLELGRSSCEVGLDRAAQAVQIILVHAPVPLVHRRRHRRRLQAEQDLPSRRVVDLVGRQLPIPQPVVGAGHRHGVTLFALAKPILGLLAHQLGLNARERDGQIDGPADVVVGAALERFHDIFAAVLGSDHDDR